MLGRLVLVSALIANSTYSYGHSGGTDANGCHAGTKPYHCHTPKGDSESEDGTSLVGVLVLVGILVWLYKDKVTGETFYKQSAYTDRSYNEISTSYQLSFKNSDFSFISGTKQPNYEYFSNADSLDTDIKMFMGVGYTLHKNGHLEFVQSTDSKELNYIYRF